MQPRIKRPQRNLFIIMSVMMMAYLLGTRLPGEVTLYLGAAVLAVAAVMVIWGRDFLVGRYRTRQRRWQEAAERYQKFEAKLLAVPLGKLAVVLYLSLYSFDGVAICRNNIAQSLMNMQDLDGAEQWLRRALQRDPLYALPYLNLGVVAAMRGDKERAAREFGRAVQLGFDPEGAQRLFRQVTARINESLGKLSD
jgi:tetratricopeptide (TPR) repeat protein